MCGVLGAFGPSATALNKNMPQGLTALQSRGPDAEGRYVSPESHCVLGHRRLAILDLSAASNQPYSIGHHHLVYNGEIYNHQNLRSQLGPRGFCTTSDTETLLRGLIEKGVSFFDSLQGMFAGAVFDDHKEELTIFRDSLGIKPLYVMQLKDSTLVFASEVKALRAFVPNNSWCVNQDALALYLHFENYSPNESLFQNVELLPKGEVRTYKFATNQKVSLAGRNEIRPSWGNNVRGVELDNADQESGMLQQVRRVVTESVTSHLLSDVPIGVYLSGGLDSSVVATLAARSGVKVKGYTGYFPFEDAHYDERPLARLVAQKAEIELQEVEITPGDFLNSFEELIYRLDEPRMGMGSFSQFMVAQAVGRERKVILSGHGGDELFAGYPMHKALWSIKKGLLSANSWDLLRHLKAGELPWLIYTHWHRLKSKRIPFAPEIFSPFRSVQDEALFYAAQDRDPLAALEQYYSQVYLPGLLLVEDKISMAHSLETRMPLWSQPVVGFFRSVDAGRKLLGSRPKALMREAFAQDLPTQLLAAPKRGFPTPLRHWFRFELKDFLKERLLNPSAKIRGLISTATVETLIDQHRWRRLPFALDERRAHKLWILLCLETWAQQWALELSWDGSV